MPSVSLIVQDQESALLCAAVLVCARAANEPPLSVDSAYWGFQNKNLLRHYAKRTFKHGK